MSDILHTGPASNFVCVWNTISSILESVSNQETNANNICMIAISIMYTTQPRNHQLVGEKSQMWTPCHRQYKAGDICCCLLFYKVLWHELWLCVCVGYMLTMVVCNINGHCMYLVLVARGGCRGLATGDKCQKGCMAAMPQETSLVFLGWSEIRPVSYHLYALWCLSSQYFYTSQQSPSGKAQWCMDVTNGARCRADVTMPGQRYVTHRTDTWMWH